MDHEDLVMDPLDTVHVFPSTKATETECGNRISLREFLQSSDLNAGHSKAPSCPDSQTPIGWVCDELAVRAGHVNTRTDNADGIDDQPVPVITFRYGKVVYSLSVRPAIADATISNDAPSSWLASLRTRAAAVAHSLSTSISDVKTDEYTAQQRMADALDMDIARSFKILHKGKILFPSSSKDDDSQQVSHRLLQLSQTEWNQHRRSCFVVMGTRRGNELKPRQSSQPSLFKSLLAILQVWIKAPVATTKHAVMGMLNILYLFGSTFVPRPGQPQLSSHRHDKDD